ncbi:hypothetical protein CA85_08170 [Allorhodopirellula solitaria]|uniref:Uncharacterized protein n=1 Tax=Allorhodopirellula solitaria TaxID=2527987 RepID=A0A5C5YHB4_9BACT|nr:hypothetical protein CA85_08170 [Allorhodopirellula solitaria]
MPTLTPPTKNTTFIRRRLSTDGSDRREKDTRPAQLRRAEPSGYFVDRRLRPSREGYTPGSALTGGAIWLPCRPTAPTVARRIHARLSSDGRSRLATLSTDGSDRREKGHTPGSAQTGGAVWLPCRPTAPTVARRIHARLSSDGRSRLATLLTDGSDRREKEYTPGSAQTGGAVWLLCRPTAPTVARKDTRPAQLRRAEPSGYFVDRRLRPSRERAHARLSSDGRSRLATLSTDGSDRREKGHTPGPALTGGAVWLLCRTTAPTVARKDTRPAQLRRAEPSGYFVDRRLRPSREGYTPGPAQTGGAVWLLCHQLAFDFLDRLQAQLVVLGGKADRLDDKPEFGMESALVQVEIS